MLEVAQNLDLSNFLFFSLSLSFTPSMRATKVIFEISANMQTDREWHLSNKSCRTSPQHTQTNRHTLTYMHIPLDIFRACFYRSVSPAVTVWCGVLFVVCRHCLVWGVGRRLPSLCGGVSWVLVTTFFVLPLYFFICVVWNVLDRLGTERSSKHLS